jgi:hypothetical protein
MMRKVVGGKVSTYLVLSCTFCTYLYISYGIEGFTPQTFLTLSLPSEPEDELLVER